jgi:hypothetical protein
MVAAARTAAAVPQAPAQPEEQALPAALSAELADHFAARRVLEPAVE